MTTLNLGVVVIPYAAAYRPPPKFLKQITRGGRAYHTGYAKGQTTGTIAHILEDRYGIMRVFYDQNKSTVISMIEDALAGAIKNVLAGGPPTIEPAAQGMQQIASMFKHDLSQRRFDGLTSPGKTPTAAAMRGVSHRFKRPYVRRPSRPSFIDTGLYQASFKAWID
jgi:hypothetical protein